MCVCVCGKKESTHRRERERKGYEADDEEAAMKRYPCYLFGVYINITR